MTSYERRDHQTRPHTTDTPEVYIRVYLVTCAWYE